jgi:hypothetical protein
MHEPQKMIDWAHKILESDKYTQIRSAPWTSIYRFETLDGDVYLKHCIPGLFVEVAVIQQIEKIAPGKVAPIIAINEALHCFLMKDAGVPLRSVIKEKFDIDLLIQALHQYTDIQIKLSDRIPLLLEMGLPDFRLEHFPSMYHELLNDQHLMQEIGLTADDVKRFASIDLNPICQKIMSYNIKPSFDQSDFQDNNILWDEHSQWLTHIDLGESVISHPFFALHTFLFMAHFCGYYQKNDAIHQQLIETCLFHFRTFETDENLKTVFKLTHLLQPLYYIFSLERLIKLCEKQGLRDDFVNSHGIVVFLRKERKNIPTSLQELWINFQKPL